METRRDTLKIIGAIGSTCAFPFGANDLYGQQEHHHAAALAQVQSTRAPFTPKFFSALEYQTISRIADLIIPPTDTPGAAAAGVPEYIDNVLTNNSDVQKTMRDGLAWIDSQSTELHKKRFVELGEDDQIAILRQLSNAVDRAQVNSIGALFFRMIKSMTADGYYTSQAGLVQELGYKGNTVLAAFPGCDHPEHA